MAKASNYTNAVLVYNLGCEMIYVLHHRLQSLKVDYDKIIKTLIDICRTLFSEKITQKLFEPKPLLGLEYIKSQLFQVCHCSIITLDTTSFTKLYEMILIAIKKQILTSANMHGLYHITTNHLATVSKIIKDKSILAKVTKDFENIFVGLMSNYDYYIMRCKILNSQNPKNVKVSFYLADKTQSNDGNIVVQPPETAGFSIVKLGTVYDTFTKIGNTNIANFACYKYVKTNPSDDFKNEKYLVGNNVFDTLQIENHDVDYVVTDKDYIAKESEELMKAITGNVKRRNSTVDEKIKIDFLSLGSRTS